MEVALAPTQPPDQPERWELVLRLGMDGEAAAQASETLVRNMFAAASSQDELLGPVWSGLAQAATVTREGTLLEIRMEPRAGSVVQWVGSLQGSPAVAAARSQLER
jgi:hypothetical protein